ncbi:hypothetical protein [Methanogenium cariaci]|jgi:uncharacterized protein YwgA
MNDRPYYSVRSGRNNGKLDLTLEELKDMFFATYQDFERKYYFQEAFGYECVDAGFVPGIAGNNVSAYFFRKLRKRNIWPIRDNIDNYSEEDLFDLIEILYDLISFPDPEKGYYHEWNDCGWHYQTFIKEKGQNEYKTEINSVIANYENGYELSSEGEILEIIETGFEELFETETLVFDPENIDGRIRIAIHKFRKYQSTEQDKKEAVRELADVLEYLKRGFDMRLLSKDENDLFNIANNYAIRHHTPNQKNGYDKPIWLKWIFYAYLASINLLIELEHKKRESADSN